MDAGSAKARGATDEDREKSNKSAKGSNKPVEATEKPHEETHGNGGSGTLASEGSAALASAVETAGDTLERRGEQVQQVYERATDIVQRRPGSAVASAFGIGIVVGISLVLAIRHR
jgi:hypothetical protein